MFLGEHRHAIDNKGRLAIPSKFRVHLSDGLIITRGLDKCLFIFSKSDWDNLAKKLKDLPLSQANSRAFTRLFLAGAVEEALDQQGRVLVPEYLRAYAQLQKKAVVVGVYNRIEVWEESQWEHYRQETEKNSEDIAEKLGELGV